MKTQLLILAASLALSASSFADPVTVHTLAGEALKGELIRLEPDGIAIETDSGIAKVAFANLVPEDRATFGFDPKAAAAYQVAVANAQNARLQALNAVPSVTTPAATELTPDPVTDKRLTAEAHAKAVAAFKVWQHNASQGANIHAIRSRDMYQPGEAPSLAKMEAKFKEDLVTEWRKKMGQ